jgi:N6-L-threonylcarbamoyladenine synthase
MPLCGIMEIKMEDIMILGIESSCDETAAAVVRNGREVLSNVINTQIDIHKKFGGVVPEVASRHHIENIDIVVDEALSQAGVTFDDIDAIAVTYGPGLIGALLVGVSAAKAFAFALDKPLIPVHHIKGHICANFVAHKDLEPPFVCLVASGGHSHIVEVVDYTRCRILGRTRDDAAGEAFDKVARVLGLGYPGGPLIDKLAKEGDPEAVNFPRVNMAGDSLDFSFSGVKTAVINYLHKLDQNGESYNKADIAASFQAAVTDVLCSHTIEAAKRCGSKTIALAGGVASNSALRAKMSEKAAKEGIATIYPPPVLCTDNAVMIACAGYYGYLNGDRADMTLNAVASLDLE